MKITKVKLPKGQQQGTAYTPKLMRDYGTPEMRLTNLNDKNIALRHKLSQKEVKRRHDRECSKWA